MSKMLRLSIEQYNKLTSGASARGRQGSAAIPPRSSLAAASSLALGQPKPDDPHLKYRNRPTGGYSSVKEARRAAELKLLAEAGEITNLREQVCYEVIPAQRDPMTGEHIERAAHYVADFVYDRYIVVPVSAPEQRRAKDGRYVRTVVEDVKGMRTKEYILKRKLMLLVHHVRIEEI